MTTTAAAVLALGLLAGPGEQAGRADAAATGTVTVVVTLSPGSADGGPTRLDLHVRRRDGELVARRVGYRTQRFRLTTGRYTLRAVQRRCADARCADPGAVLVRCRRTVAISSGEARQYALGPRDGGGCGFTVDRIADPTR